MNGLSPDERLPLSAYPASQAGLTVIEIVFVLDETSIIRYEAGMAPSASSPSLTE